MIGRLIMVGGWIGSDSEVAGAGRAGWISFVAACVSTNMSKNHFSNAANFKKVIHK